MTHLSTAAKAGISTVIGIIGLVHGSWFWSIVGLGVAAYVVAMRVVSSSESAKRHEDAPPPTVTGTVVLIAGALFGLVVYIVGFSGVPIISAVVFAIGPFITFAFFALLAWVMIVATLTGEPPKSAARIRRIIETGSRRIW
jgi:hypothetical protein